MVKLATKGDTVGLYGPKYMGFAFYPIQTITLSGCRVIECCSSSCEIDAPKKDDDLPVAMKGEEYGRIPAKRPKYGFPAGL